MTRMLRRGGVATPDMAAPRATAQVEPPPTGGEALEAARAARQHQGIDSWPFANLVICRGMVPVSGANVGGRYPGSGSSSHCCQIVGRRDEVVRAGKGGCKERQVVAGPAVEADHASSIRQRTLAGAEADEDGAVAVDDAVSDVAAEDLAEPVLVGAGDVRGRRLRVELGAVGLAAPDAGSCAGTGRLSHADASCSHCCSSRIEPPSPGSPGAIERDGRAPRRATGSPCRR